ncbi:MAG TPA: acyl carrier protein [Gammaproteobacteria bacterium]|nr:acyl carrier protein [Gammaproteobacteria bacterium]
MENLEHSIKTLIIECLNLEEIQPEDIDSNASLFVEGLGLDSIDALELGIAIKKKFQVTLNADSRETRDHFSSVKSLARFIASQSD